MMLRTPSCMTSRGVASVFRAMHGSLERDFFSSRPISQNRSLRGKHPIQGPHERDLRSGSCSSVDCSDDDESRRVQQRLHATRRVHPITRGIGKPTETHGGERVPRTPGGPPAVAREKTTPPRWRAAGSLTPEYVTGGHCRTARPGVPAADSPPPRTPRLQAAARRCSRRRA